MIDEQTQRRSTFWRELPILLGVAIVVAILVRAFVLQTFYIPSESMEHTLNINDRVLVNKLVYDFRDPRRGEIVVFTAPQEWKSDPTETDFIKRVIGIGGDHVKCCVGGKITINGKVLDEPYLNTDDGANLPASPEQFDVTWSVIDGARTRIELRLDASLSVPRLLPVGGLEWRFIRPAHADVDGQIAHRLVVILRVEGV